METFVPATKVRRIVTVHHLEPSRTKSPFSRRGICVHMAAWRLRKAITTADVMVTQSQFTAKQVAEAYDVSRCRMAVVGSGASEEVFSSRSDASLDGLIPDHNPFLLVVGALDFRKGCDYLISLAREFQARNSPLKIACTAGTYGNAAQIAETEKNNQTYFCCRSFQARSCWPICARPSVSFDLAFGRVWFAHGRGNGSGLARGCGRDERNTGDFGWCGSSC